MKSDTGIIKTEGIPFAIRAQHNAAKNSDVFPMPQTIAEVLKTARNYADSIPADIKINSEKHNIPGNVTSDATLKQVISNRVEMAAEHYQAFEKIVRQSSLSLDSPQTLEACRALNNFCSDIYRMLDILGAVELAEPLSFAKTRLDLHLRFSDSACENTALQPVIGALRDLSLPLVSFAQSLRKQITIKEIFESSTEDGATKLAKGNDLSSAAMHQTDQRYIDISDLTSDMIMLGGLFIQAQVLADRQQSRLNEVNLK